MLVDCNARQEQGVLLRRMSHEDHVDVIKGPCLHQVDLSSDILLRRGSKNCYLVEGKKKQTPKLNLAFRCKNIKVTQGNINRDTIIIIIV